MYPLSNWLITGWLNGLGIQFPYQTILFSDILSNVTLVHRWNLNLIKIRSSYTYILAPFYKAKEALFLSIQNGQSKFTVG